MKFKDLLFEIITELGDTTSSYDWRVYSNTADKVEFEFKSRENTYKVILDQYIPQELDVSYEYKNEEGRYTIGLTNENNQFRVISTVVSIVKHAWENREKYFREHQSIEGIGFVGSTRDDESFTDDGTARTRLYLQFIKRQFPNAEIDHSIGDVKVYPAQ